MLENEETTVILQKPLAREIDVYEQKTAGFWMRFWAFVVDMLVISAIIGITINPIFYVTGWRLDDSVWYMPLSILSAIVYYAYFVVLTKIWSQTVGKMIFGLRVKKDNNEPLDWMTVIFRECVGRFISNTFFKIPYFIVVFTPDHKAIHDFAADTVVVHEEVFSSKKVLNAELMDNNTISTSSF